MNKNVNEELIKDDLYLAVNGEWLKTAKIPADKSSTGGFADLADNIEKTLMDDFSELEKDISKVEDKPLQEYLKFYKLASDKKTRDTLGFKPAQFLLQKVEQLQSWDDLKANIYDWCREGLPLPVTFSVEPDMKNTKLYALYADVASLILPDKTYYEGDNPQSEQLMSVYSNMVLKLFKLADYDEETAQKNLNAALAFDASLAPSQKDSTERADYTAAYNKFSFDDFKQLSDNFDLGNLATQLIKTTPDKVIVTEPRYFHALDDIVTEQSFELFKSWALVKTLIAVSTYLSDEARVVAGEYGRALSGSKEPMNFQKHAYYLSSQRYSQVVGLYYAHKYFGETAKNDVHDMVVKMVDVYKQRLTNNTWLSEDTKKQAVTKLGTLGINVGYPDKLPEIYTKYIVDENKDLLANEQEFSYIAFDEHFSRWNKETDRSRWEMPAHMVNAYYNPSFNIIVFPAAILQAPFYSLKQSRSENFGGIGAVIAHEISHAFDNNGAKFDEFGNMRNWWTGEDLKHFESLAQNMIDEFDGLETEAGKVNGKLVVSENIADAGGLSCALQATKAEPDYNLKEFFENWARVWALKSSIERQKFLLNIDVHAPHILRANVQPQNLDEFYTTFDIKSGDKMYLAPEKRVHIW